MTLGVVEELSQCKPRVHIEQDGNDNPDAVEEDEIEDEVDPIAVTRSGLLTSHCGANVIQPE